MSYYGLPAEPDMRPTIRVRMVADAWGCPDPRTRVQYLAGQEYDLPEDLAECFFSTHSADPAEAHEQPSSDPESQEAAPEVAEGTPRIEIPAQEPKRRRSAR